MNLGGIPIRVVDADAPANGSPAHAVLHEILTLLDGLLAEGRVGAVDLRSLPLATADMAALEERLGQGEVYAEIELSGMSRVYETAYAGVWRVTHYGDGEQIIADVIEVNWVPDILCAHREDVMGGRERLRAALPS